MIYTINLRDPAGLFLASSFEMRNKDILYASNSLSVEATKFMNYLKQPQHDDPGADYHRHQRIRLAEHHPRHRRSAQHLCDRGDDDRRHDAGAVRLAPGRNLDFNGTGTSPAAYAVPQHRGESTHRGRPSLRG